MNIKTDVLNNRASMMVYGCGGTGANIVSVIRPGEANPVFCRIDTAFVDTSMANVESNDIDLASFYHITKADTGEALDGSGRMRSTNPKDIIAHMPAVLSQFKPGDINIVVCSGGGGSGSVIAPALVGELLARGKLVVPILVGCNKTDWDVINTCDAIHSYFTTAQDHQVGLPMVFIENSPKMTRGEINNKVLDVISHLSLLFSRMHKGLDSRDLEHFLHYTKTAKYLQPSAAFIAIGSSNDEIMSQTRAVSTGTGKEVVVTLASLASDQDSFVSDIEARVHFEGFTGNTVTDINSDRPLFFAVVINVMEQVLARYQSLRTQTRTEKTARVVMSVAAPVGNRVGNIVISDD